MNEYIINAAMMALTGIGTWFAARRKNLAEVTSNELDNATKAVKYYREMLDDMAIRYKEVVKELDDLKEHMKRSDEQLQHMMQENRELVDELKKYKQLNGKH